MNLDQQTGKYMILGGLLIMLAGAVFYFFPGKTNWIGNLPGDIAVKGKNFSIYFPWVTMLVLSAVISILLYLVRRFF